MVTFHQPNSRGRRGAACPNPHRRRTFVRVFQAALRYRFARPRASTTQTRRSRTFTASEAGSGPMTTTRRTVAYPAIAWHTRPSSCSSYRTSRPSSPISCCASVRAASNAEACVCDQTLCRDGYGTSASFPNSARSASRAERPSTTARRTSIFEFSGWEDTVERVSFVEIIVRLELDQTAKPADVMNAGRRAVASLRAQLDLTFGPRVLGALLLEEIGRVFDDWDWNRRLDTVQLAAETQVPEEVVPGQRFAEIFSAAASQHLAKDRQQQRRFAPPSPWYWLSRGWGK